MLRKITLRLLFILVLPLLLMACGDEEDTGGNDSVDDEQVLVYARGADSESLDFSSTSDGESARVTVNIFENLVGYDRDSFEIVPALAHDWDISDDGKTYTFYLEEGVKFHDGTDFNAEAVKVNFDRWADPENEYAFTDEGYSYPLYGVLFGGYEGDEDHAIEEINVIDDYEIEFVLKRSVATFLKSLGSTYFSITSPASFEEYGAEVNEHPVGTGPFKFVSWTKDDKIVLEKNDDYRIDGLPKLDKVIYEVIPDNAARLTALRSGEVDIIDDVNPDDGASIEEEKDLRLYKRGENNIGFLGFNINKEPLDDQTFREAIAYAINKEELVEALYSGYGTKAVNLIPPNFLGYNDKLEDRTYDLDKAKELLAKSEYEEGTEIDFWVMPVSRPYMPDPEKVAEIIQNDLNKIGITLNIVREEWAPYLEKTKQGEHEMFLLGLSSTNGDPDNILYQLLHADSVGGNNRTFYNNEEANKLLIEAKSTLDEEEREELYEKVQQIAYEEVPMVPLVHSKPLVVAKNTVENFVPHPSTSDPLKEVELSE